MMTDFDRALVFVLSKEGGYVNDPRDPGGETKFGISKKAYPDLTIKNLTKEDAADIYRIDYWQKAGCQELEWPLNLVVFDTAVNLGVKRALRIKEEAFNWTEYLFLRLAIYSRLVANAPRFGVYLRGWMNRVIDLHRAARQ